MAIVPAQARRAQRDMVVSGGGMLLNTLAHTQGARDLQAALQQLVRSNPVQQPRNQPNRKQKPKRRSAGPGTNNYSGNFKGSLVRSTHLPPMRVQGQALVALSNFVLNVTTGANVATIGVSVGAISLSITDYIISALGSASVIPRLNTYAGLFRNWKLKSLGVRYIPAASDNDSGTIGVCIDADPYTGVLTTPGAAITRDYSLVSSIRMQSEFTWKPQGRKENTERAVYGGTDGAGRDRSYDEFSWGRLLWYSTNGMTSSAQFGNLVLTYDVEFSDAK